MNGKIDCEIAFSSGKEEFSNCIFNELQLEPKRPVFHPNICFLMVLIRLIYENKGDIVILRIMFKKRLCKLSRVSVKITTFLRLHNFQSSSIVLPLSMSIFFVFTYIHHYTMHQC